MASGEPPAQIFDVLYVDQQKLSSLYAQLFSGLLESKTEKEG